MSSEPLPDHYKNLGVDKNADQATIKKTYRKLVLTCHPDKVTDEALKAQKQEEFHKIQQAYETLSDETRRATYEAELKLAQLRREKLARTASGTTVEPKSARFAHPTTGGASYNASTAPRYATEERKPSGTRAYDEEERYDSRRKNEESYFVRPSASSRSSREKESSSKREVRPSGDRTRSSATKARDNERRDRRFVSVEDDGSSSDDRARYERDHKRRSDEDARRSERRTDDRRYADHDTPRKMSAQAEDAIRYIYKSVEADKVRPSPVSASSRDYYADEYNRPSRHREARPDPAPRRSSARPKESSRARDTDRGFPDIVDWERPSFKHTSSSPAEIRIPATASPRAHTESSREHRRSDRSPPPFLSRSATMPTVPGANTSSRRKDASYSRSSGLRNEAGSSPEQRDYPVIPPPSTTYYSYSQADGGVKPVDGPTHHKTVLREPEHFRRSPSPIGKPPMGANRPTLHSSKTYTPGRSSRQSSPVREERGRSGRGEQLKYGEIPSDYSRSRRMPERPGMSERQSSYGRDDVSYSRKYGPEDVRWAPRSREADQYVERKPTLGRTSTAVY